MCGGCALWLVFGPVVLIALPEEVGSMRGFNVLITEFVMPTFSLFLQAQFSHHHGLSYPPNIYDMRGGGSSTICVEAAVDPHSAVTIS